MIAVLLADGFEELEALSPVDLLYRAGCDVKTVAVKEEKTVVGSHGIAVTADALIGEIVPQDLSCLVLPGGMPGTLNLEKSRPVQTLIDVSVQRGIFIGAICAAPSILGHKGLLKGKRAVCFPGFEKDLQGAEISEKPVVSDGNFITAKGAGVAVEFALELIARLKSPDAASRIRESIQCV